MNELRGDQKKKRRLEMLAEVASMYYEQNFTQAEIADRFFLSRSQVSRLLKSAHENGIVEIRVNHYGERSYELENLLKLKFGLKEAFILNTRETEYTRILQQMGQLAASYIDSQIKDVRVLGITWGKSIAATIESLHGFPHKNLEVVQVIGGTLIQNPIIDISGITQKLIQKYSASGVYLNAPLFMGDAQSVETLKREPVITYCLQKARNADMIITGIGSVVPETFAYMYKGYDNQVELNALMQCGAVGFICAQAFDDNGTPVCNGFNEKVIGITLPELKHVKTVVGISGGKQKAAAVMGMLRAGYCNVLVSDRTCILEILKHDRDFLTMKNVRR